MKRPSAKKKVVLVTGSNKGIGYGIIETLLEKKSNLIIILTSRNEELGQKSFNELLSKYPYSKDYFFYHQLDITNKDSISTLCDWVKTKFGEIDYLVNNAGLGTHGVTTDINLNDAVLETNVYGTIDFTERMLKYKMINSKGKIICVGSMMGNLNKLSKNLRFQFKKAKTYHDLLHLADLYKKSYKANSLEMELWCPSSYSVSKMIVNIYPRILSYREDIY